MTIRIKHIQNGIELKPIQPSLYIDNLETSEVNADLTSESSSDLPSSRMNARPSDKINNLKSAYKQINLLSMKTKTNKLLSEVKDNAPCIAINIQEQEVPCMHCF